MINIEEFWNDCKDELSISIQAISYEVWIEKLEPVCFADGAIVLSTISATAKKTIDNKYKDTIREVASAINSSVKDVVIITPDKKEEYLKNQTDFLEDGGFVVSSPAPIVKKKNPACTNRQRRARIQACGNRVEGGQSPHPSRCTVRTGLVYGATS